MAITDADINALYQLPAGEFTAARNALAKRAGPRAGEIRRLSRPTTPAWAVNQLYWRERDIYDRVTRAAVKVRASHARRLSGKDADVVPAESAHGAALKAALSAVRDVLGAAGERPTSAVMTAVGETLRALPGPDRPGRLSRPMRPLGLEALVGVMPTTSRTARKRAVLTFPAPPPRSGAAAARELAAASAAAARETARLVRERARERARLERRRRGARAAARRAEAGVAAADAALARASAARERALDRARAAAAEVRRLDAAIAALGD